MRAAAVALCALFAAAAVAAPARRMRSEDSPMYGGYVLVTAARGTSQSVGFFIIKNINLWKKKIKNQRQLCAKKKF